MFSGAIVALVTPFTPALQVDYTALRELIEWQIQEGIDAVMVCGSTGEAPTLTPEEQINIIKTAVDVANGRVPVIAGTGTNDTRRTVLMTKEAQECGADGCLVVVPYYNRPSAEGCLRHFQEVAKIGLPVIVYHHPVRTGVKLSAKALAQISQIPQVVAIKENSGDLDFAMEVQRLSSSPLLTGDDPLTLPLMAVGGAGGISVVANIIPSAWKSMVSSFSKGDPAKALSIFQRYYALCRAMVIEVNPQCVKYALSALGKCHPYFRLPLMEPQDAAKEQIDAALVGAGLKLKDVLSESRV